MTLALNDFLQVIKVEEEVCAICIRNGQLLAYFDSDKKLYQKSEENKTLHPQ